LAAAVFLDAVVVRCVMLPAVLQLLGPLTWKLPRWLDQRLPRINIEGSSVTDGVPEQRVSPDGATGPAQPSTANT
jgi:RND superfamily putative drug exporter